MLTVALAYAASGIASTNEAQQAAKFTATPLEADGAPIQAAKSRVGRIAETDPELLGRTDSTPVNVMVKLDYDSVATYAGGVQGLAATSPNKTGKKLKQNRGAVDAYEAHIASVEGDIVADIGSAVSNETVRSSYRVAYGGVAMQLPANQIGDLLGVDGVVAVQKDSLEQPLTTVSPAFTGASAVWPSLGGPSKAGEGVIVGVLDTGIWPEHPSFVDPGISHPGGTYGCEFGGADPLLGAPFTCNDKLIGAYAKTATYMANIGAVAGENCNNVTDQCSARDADGHGTHTSSTAAGGPVANANLLGVNRGAVSGMAPGAHVIMYRVCLRLGCFGSDSVSAVNQAIVDGADVLNFSISGGVSAYTDPVELAFLDAYEAGILVNASAGNAGPAAATANHAGPWTNTVGASTSNRHFFSTLQLSAADSSTLDVQGVTVTSGISTATDVVRAETLLGGTYSPLCLTPLPAATVTGKIVACRRGTNARVDKGFNVLQGGAAGMILYNPALQGLNSDNHWLPSIHTEGPNAALTAFLAKAGVKARWVSGTATPVTGDVMAPFSSRGPLGDFIKPDVTSVGVQVLAGHTPDPFDGNITAGPTGQLYQAIAGTSMSSPHSAGISALVKDAHPDWTPGQIKSALMTSSVQEVFKENGTTPADPFDRGAGSIRANRAVNPTVTFDVTAAQYIASAADPLNRIHLNLPSVNASPMPGLVTTTRTLKNVTDTQQPLKVSATSSPGTTIDVSPKTLTVGAGETATIEITIDATGASNGQYFGQITLDSNKPGYNDAVLPVAFRKGQGLSSLVHACVPTTISVGSSADCVVEAQNLSPVPAQVALTVQGPNNGQLTIQNVSAPGVPSGNGFTWNGTLTAALAPKVESLTPGGSPAGYLPLSIFGIAPIAGVGDETITNFNVAPFKWGTETYTRIGMTSNGYVIVGGGTATDVEFVPQTFPDPTAPNNVQAPYWTDLNPGAGGAMRAGSLTDGVDTWLVLDWQNVPIFGTATPRSFQVWIQLGATEGTWFTYGPAGQIGAGSSDGLNVGAENRDGTSGKNLGAIPAAGSDLQVNTSGPTPGGKVTITYDAFGRNAGEHDIIASMTSSIVSGVTTDRETITVTK